jgi:hypothetical protein
MSLLDDDFDVRLEDVIASGIRNQCFQNCTDYYIRQIFGNINENIDFSLNVEPITPSESGEYYVGVDYLKINDKIRVKIKLFDPKYVIPQPHRTIIMSVGTEYRRDYSGSWWSHGNPVYVTENSQGRIGNYVILGAMQSRGWSLNGWSRYSIDQIINDISTPNSIDEYSRS